MRRLAAAATALAAILVWVVLSASAGSGTSGTYLVRAIFDNAAFAVPGEDVRIAGANVGSISSVSVTRSQQAAVTLSIDNSDFIPFHADASCRIRPQSLIAERFVDCQPGTSGQPSLRRIVRGAGAGDYLLPSSRTSTSIDPDIVQDISQEPLRERLSIILDELGTGLAARGADLQAVIQRADPALGYTDRVFRLLAGENRVLARLASDGDKVLRPLARVRSRIADFILQANSTATASATRAADISRSFKLLPGFLSRLHPLMTDLGRLAAQGTPVMASLQLSARALDREFLELTPFAETARPALEHLGASAKASQPLLIDTEPLDRRLEHLGAAALPSGRSLARLTGSLDATGAIEQLMALLFYGTGASNGFDQDGHYVRAEPLVGGCTAYKKKPVLGCSARWGGSASAAAASVARAAVAQVHQPSSKRAGGVLAYLIGSGATGGAAR